MQIDQGAYGDPRPVVGIMAHAYANPLISAKHNSGGSSSSNSSGGGTDTDVAAGGGGEGEAGPQAAAEAAANELVIDALLAAEADTIGPEVKFLGLPRGAATPPKKPHGGAWRGADGLRVVESALPEGLVKRGWLHKHTQELPGSLVYLATVDVSATAEDWADTEDEIVADLRSVVSGLAERDVKVGGVEGSFRVCIGRATGADFAVAQAVQQRLILHLSWQSKAGAAAAADCCVWRLLVCFRWCFLRTHAPPSLDVSMLGPMLLLLLLLRLMLALSAVMAAKGQFAGLLSYLVIDCLCTTQRRPGGCPFHIPQGTGWNSKLRYVVCQLAGRVPQTVPEVSQHAHTSTHSDYAG